MLSLSLLVAWRENPFVQGKGMQRSEVSLKYYSTTLKAWGSGVGLRVPGLTARSSGNNYAEIDIQFPNEQFFKST